MKRRLLTLVGVSVVLGLAVAWVPRGPAVGPTETDKANIATLMAGWEKEVRGKIARDPELKALAARYPLVLLCSRRYQTPDNHARCAYSFIQDPSDKTAEGSAHICYDNGAGNNTFEINFVVTQQDLMADLGMVDFTKDPDPRQVDINGDGQQTWMADNTTAVEGHVYLERVKNDYGTRFYVLFQVIAVEPGRYMAFIWRRLPGGRVVEPPWAKR